MAEKRRLYVRVTGEATDAVRFSAELLTCCNQDDVKAAVLEVAADDAPTSVSIVLEITR